MNELAKQLREAGFPYKTAEDFDYLPPLSELIEACGVHFLTLERYEAAYWVARGICGEYQNGIRGENAESVVAKLWLWIDLNK